VQKLFYFSKMIKKISAKLMFLINFVISIYALNCPSADLLYPCRCIFEQNFNVRTSIHCLNIGERFKLRKIFDEIKKVGHNFDYLSEIWINNTMIENIYHEIFAGLKLENFFSGLVVSHNKNLSHIHPEAFRDFDPEFIYIHDNPKLKNKIFSAIKNLKHVSEYHLFNNNIEKIPRAAFKNARSVYYIGLQNNLINHISTHAFSMLHEMKEDETLHVINLKNNKLNSRSFELGAFEGLHSSFNCRPICWEIQLSFNNISYLDEKIFAPFLNSECVSSKNKSYLLVDKNPFVCDCRMKWLIDNKDRYKNSVIGILCKNDNNRDFWTYSAEDFENCTKKNLEITQTSTAMPTILCTTFMTNSETNIDVITEINTSRATFPSNSVKLFIFVIILSVLENLEHK
jgi:hypothetical protein